MSVMKNTLLISIFLISVAVGMIYVEEMNAQHERDTGRKFIDYEATPFLNYTDLDIIGTTPGQFNTTSNEIATFDKAEDIGFDFWFFQGIKLYKLTTSLLVYTVIGVPAIFSTVSGVPAFLVTGVMLIIGITFFLFLVYMLVGKFN